MRFIIENHSSIFWAVLLIFLLSAAVHLTGEFKGKIFGSLIVWDNETSPGVAFLEDSFPAGLTDPGSILSHFGALYVVDSSGNELWRIDELTDPEKIAEIRY